MFSSNAYFPLLLGDIGDEENTDREAFFQRIFLFKQLSQQECDFIVSDFVTESLKALEKNFSLSNEEVQTVTRTIRRFYFKEISQNETLLLLEKDLLSRNPNKTTILNFIQKNLLSYTIPEDFFSSFEQQGNNDVKKNIILLSLKKALEKYPRIINAPLTEEDITFRGSNGPVSPTLKNWITAYHQEVGSGTHEPFERSQFLFHNGNATKLTQRERNILSEIFRSLDDASELPINTDTQSIDFSSIEEKFSKEERMGIPPQINSTPKNFQSTSSQTFLSHSKSNQKTPPSPFNVPANTGKNSFSGNTLSKKISFQEKSIIPNTPVLAPQTPSLQIHPEMPTPQRAENKTSLSQSQEDFTEYYPISKNQKSLPPSIATNISFSSPHTFPIEKEAPSQSSSQEDTMAPIPAQSQNKKLLIG